MVSYSLKVSQDQSTGDHAFRIAVGACRRSLDEIQVGIVHNVIHLRQLACHLDIPLRERLYAQPNHFLHLAPNTLDCSLVASRQIAEYSEYIWDVMSVSTES